MKSGKRITTIFILSLVLLFSAALSVQAAPSAVNQTGPSSQFSDVNAQIRNAEYIQYLAQRGLMNGYPDGTFHPGQGLTRAEAAALMVRAAGIKPTADGSVPFKDITAAYWGKPYISAATQAGFIKGYPDGTYRPNQKLTRAEGISLVLRLSKQTSNAVLPALSDMDSKHWAAGKVAEGLASGMIGLSTDNKQFLPNAPLLRSDLARALGVLLTKDPDLYIVTLEGKLTVTTGPVTLVRNGTSTELKAQDTSVVTPGDLIQAGSGANADLSFSDGSGILIKENTNLAVKEIKGRSYIKADGTPGIAVDWLLLDLKQGSIYGALASTYGTKSDNAKELTSNLSPALKNQHNLIASAGNSEAMIAAAATSNKKDMPWYEAKNTKKVKVKVDMPWGVAAVRGSFWQNFVSPSGQSITNLLTGEAEVSSGGQTVPLVPGQTSTVSQTGAPPAPPAPMSTSELQGWVQAQDWANNHAQMIQNQMQIQEQAPPPALPQESITPPVVTNPPVVPPTGPTPPGTPPSVTPPVTPPVSPIQSVVNAVQAAIKNASQTVSNPVTRPSSGSSGSSNRISISCISSNISLDLFETYLLVQNISNPMSATLSFSTNNNNVVFETGAYGLQARCNIPCGITTITVTASKEGYTSTSITFTITGTNQALAYNAATLSTALTNSRIASILLAPGVYLFETGMPDPGRTVNIYCSTGESATIRITGTKPASITIGNGVTVIDDNQGLTEPINLITISPKMPGQDVTMSGTSLLDEVLFKVIKPQPDNSILYIDVAPVINNTFTKTFTLPPDAMSGDYTVVVGQGSTVDTTIFRVGAM